MPDSRWTSRLLLRYKLTMTTYGMANRRVATASTGTRTIMTTMRPARRKNCDIRKTEHQSLKKLQRHRFRRKKKKGGRTKHATASATLTSDEDTSESRCSTSHTKRFRIRPVGLQSKKATGVFKTRLSMVSWSLEEVAMALNIEERKNKEFQWKASAGKSVVYFHTEYAGRPFLLRR